MDLVDRFRVANLALALSATEAQIHSAAWGLPAMTWEEMLDAEMAKLNSQFPVNAELPAKETEPLVPFAASRREHAKPKPKPRPKPRPGC